MKRFFLLLATLATALLAAPPVSTPAKYSIDYAKYDFIDSTLNYIQFPKGNDAFETFFKKMDTLVFVSRSAAAPSSTAPRPSAQRPSIPAISMTTMICGHGAQAARI